MGKIQRLIKTILFMAKQSALTANQIIDQIKSNDIKPIYLLMGEESYYIDLICDYIDDNVLSDEEKEFNYTMIYCDRYTKCEQIVMAARQYPVMAKYQLIIVREAQNIKDWSSFSHYLKSPLQSTIVVFCHKHKSMDKRLKIVGDIAKCGGIVFESKRKYDNEIPSWITSYIRSNGYSINPKGANLLADFLGTDLSKIVNEIDKLVILLSNTDNKEIDAELIERNIGISKDYNNFELINAIGAKQVVKVNRIVNYFSQNPKATPLIVTTSTLFNFFSNLMLFHWLSDKSPANVASELKINPYFVKDYQIAARNYNSGKTLKALEAIRTLDVKSKGFGNSNTSNHDLLRETIFKIMH